MHLPGIMEEIALFRKREVQVFVKSSSPKKHHCQASSTFQALRQDWTFEVAQLSWFCFHLRVCVIIIIYYYLFIFIY